LLDASPQQIGLREQAYEAPVRINHRKVSDMVFLDQLERFIE
jgi:hypothetical protein